MPFTPTTRYCAVYRQADGKIKLGQVHGNPGSCPLPGSTGRYGDTMLAVAVVSWVPGTVASEETVDDT